MVYSPHQSSLDDLFGRLAKSSFRNRFKLRPQERAYLEQKGEAVIEQHARDFVRQRLGPAFPKNDGKQTPTRNHPVFIAQHATASCCRKCLQKWHNIPTGAELTDEQVDYIIRVIMVWLRRV